MLFLLFFVMLRRPRRSALFHNLSFFENKPGEPKKVFLSQGDDIFIASEGDIVDRRYKIVRITATTVDIEDVLNDNTRSEKLTTEVQINMKLGWRHPHEIIITARLMVFALVLFVYMGFDKGS